MVSLNKEQLLSCFKVMAISCGIQICWMVTQIANVDFLMNARQAVNRTWGTSGHHLFLGAMLLFSLVPVYFYKKKLVIPLIALIPFCKESSSLYAMIGGMLFYLAFSTIKIKWLLIIMFILITCVLFAYYETPFDGSGSHRFPMWKRVIESTLKCNKRVWIGQGIGTFKGENWLDDAEKVHWSRAHNTYIQIFREQGAIGLILFLLIPLRCFVHFIGCRFSYIKEKKKLSFNLSFEPPRTQQSLIWMSAIVMILLNAVGNFPDRNLTLSFYAMFIFACYYVFNIRVCALQSRD